MKIASVQIVCLATALGFFCICDSTCLGEDAISSTASAPRSEAVDFKNDLIPVLTKSGCNAGACHGAAVGRGGFKLSLYGGNPSDDYDAIARHLQGRRVNLSDPDSSLILLKPTEQMEHGGEQVLEYDGHGARLLRRWIAEGTRDISPRSLTRVEISPTKQTLQTIGDTVDLRSTAFYSDGTQRDVTQWTIFSAEDVSAVKVDDQAGQASVNRRGRHVVVARYLNQVVPIELIMPLTDQQVSLDDERRDHFIDTQVLQSLATLAVPVSPIVDDATFLRRVTLDLTGRLPSVADALAASNASTPLDRAALVNRLLDSDAFVQFWTLKLAELLRIRAKGEEAQAAMKTYHAWLADQIRADRGYNQLASDVILASGDSTANGPANFYRTVDGPREQAEFMSELFMGSRLRCANCHNHPLDRWTQDDYHGLAAIFAKIEPGRVIKPKPRGEVIHPRTLEPAVQKIPGEAFLHADITDGRKELARWLTDDNNPYFAKAIVNRLWKSMMGRGLVEPADDFRATNPATHPELLDQLADDFKANGYRLRHTLRTIANSATYARSANANQHNKDDDRFYSRALRKPMGPEVLADAISDVLGVSEKYGGEKVGVRAVALIDPNTPSQTLDILGRCGRDESCESAGNTSGGLPQKLHLFNGQLLNARIRQSGGRLERMIVAGKKPRAIINVFYLAALGRSPTSDENAHWTEQISGLTPGNQQHAFLEDFVWSLLTSEEFGTNH